MILLHLYIFLIDYISWANSFRSSCAKSFSTSPFDEFFQEIFSTWTKLCFCVRIRHLSKNFRVSRVWVHTCAHLLQALFVHHCVGDLRNNVAGWTTNQGCSQNIVLSLDGEDLVKIFCWVAKRPVIVLQWLCIYILQNAFFFELLLIHANSGNLWRSVSACRQNYCIMFFFSEEERVSHDDACLNIGGMRKSLRWSIVWTWYAISTWVNFCVSCL